MSRAPCHCDLLGFAPLPASAASRVCDGKSCSDSKRNLPSLAFLTHFLILPAISPHGKGWSHTGLGFLPILTCAGELVGPSEPQFPYLTSSALVVGGLGCVASVRCLASSRWPHMEEPLATVSQPTGVSFGIRRSRPIVTLTPIQGQMSLGLGQGRSRQDLLPTQQRWPWSWLGVCWERPGGEASGAGTRGRTGAAA